MSWEREEAAYRALSHQTGSRIVFLIFDGLGDVPGADGTTPLEAATKPNLDRLAKEGTCGFFDPVAPGITPGSGPGHLGLFGYDPLRHAVGRGVLSALGIDFPLQASDVAARFNYCTLDADGRVVDRRAGRISTRVNEQLTARLSRELSPGEPDVELFLRPVSEHRGLLVLRGAGLGARLDDTDPQETGVLPLEPRGDDTPSQRTATIVGRLIEQARRVLSDQERANGLLFRGFDCRPDIDSLPQRFGLRPVCIAQYPMYRGLARLVGMEVPAVPADLAAFPAALAEVWDDHDFFFCHVKYTDKAGEDGDFLRKRQVIEEVDELVPSLLGLKPDVVVVSADHSTPVPLSAHSWHPVPTLLWAPRTVRRDAVTEFGEGGCASGGLGRFHLRYLLPLALAHAGKLKKYGA